MPFKIISLLGIFASASALLQSQIIQQPISLGSYAPLGYNGQPILRAANQIAYAQPILKTLNPISYTQPILKQSEEYDANPQYSFAYDVQDSITGDNKFQQESRSGDYVKGQYGLNDADGYRRTVDYTADPINGFNAVVSREPLAVKTISAQPIIKTVAPTIAYSQPIVKSGPIVYSQPILRAASPLAATYAAPSYTSYSGPTLLKAY